MCKHGELFEPHHDNSNLFMTYVNNKGADQPVHPHSLISTFIVRCLDRIIPILAIAKTARLSLSLCSRAG